jgi:hypothetical protein
MIAVAAGSQSGPAAIRFPQFVDVAKQSGLFGFTNHQGSLRKDFILESIGGGCAFIDYDRDGWLDVLLVRGSDGSKLTTGGSPVAALYRNKRDGTFEDVSNQAGLLSSLGWGMGVAVADYDNDGWEDFYITGYARSFLFRNRGNGTFSEQASKAGLQALDLWSTGAAFFDADRDGDLDLYVARYVKFSTANPVKRSAQCKFKGMGVFCGPQGFVSDTHSFYRNNGNGTFSDVSATAGISNEAAGHGLGVMASDFDNDGWVDVYVANDSTPNLLWRNMRNGTFRNIAPETGVAYSADGMEQASMGVDAGDLFNRGYVDVYVTNFSGESYELYKNRGPRGGFEDATAAAGLATATLPHLGWGTHMIDLEGDGWLDLIAINGHVYPEADAPETGTTYKQSLLAFRNNRDGTFSGVARHLGPGFAARYAGRGSALGDYDNDGDVDLLINSIDGPPALLRNEGIDGANWLSVELKGPRTIGARILARTPGLTQLREVNSQSGYLSSSAKRAHFALPSGGAVDELVIEWPSGTRQTLRNVPARQRLTVVEQHP